jgi:hypothetical protein
MSRKGGGLGCTGCFFIVCVVVTAALVVLPSLESWRRRLGASFPAPPSPPPARVPKPLKQFQRVDLGRRAQLSWGFVDYEQRTHQVWCGVDLDAHAEEVRKFGYVQEEAQAEVAQRIAPLARAAVEALGYGESVQLWAEGSGLRWQIKPLQQVEQAMTAIKSAVDEVWAREEHRIANEVYSERGFLVDDTNTLHVDYAGVAARASPLLEGCVQVLAGSGAGYDLGQYLGLFVAFLQDIPYELPPGREGSKQTGGFWVPTEVLLGNHGDCDSKSAVFCAMWRYLGTPALIIQLPEHVLVGVAVPPRPGQQWVRMGSHTFVLCEVAGPGRRRPGDRRPVSGHFRYTLVEPTREGFTVTHGQS